MISALHAFLLAVGGSLPASIVAKATIVAASGLLGARLARRNRAAVRHVLLAAAFGVMLLLPIASIVFPAIHIAVPTVAQDRTVSPPLAGDFDTIEPLTIPNPHSPATSEMSELSRLSLATFLMVGWAAGAALVLIPMITGLWKLRSLRRSGLPWGYGQLIVDRLALEAGVSKKVELLLHEVLPGPIASGLLSPVILLPPDAETWEKDDLNRALVHELEHVRRGDFVSHSLARVVCAMYWFHPLVWIAWRQLVLEAERSCDDAVLSCSEATAYAEQLVGLARRLLMATKSPVLAMANRFDLGVRVSAVLDARQPRGRAGRSAVALGCVLAAAVAFTVSPLTTVPASQSVPAKSRMENSLPIAAPLPSFAVATIKPDRSGRISSFPTSPPGIFKATSSTARDLVAYAFLLRSFQVSGGPSWAGSDRYEVEAKADDSQIEALRKLPQKEINKQMNLMIKALLADRFKLKAVRTTRNGPVYALVIAKNGPKLHEAQPGEAHPNGLKESDGRPLGSISAMQGGRGRLTGQAVPLATFASILGMQLNRTVLDQTSLKGKYDFTLQWTPDENDTWMLARPADDAHGTQPPSPSNTSGPSLFTAIREQLGLKLKSTKGPVDVIVIDHMERPSEN